MIEVSKLHKLINIKSINAKYYNSIAYMYGILDDNSKLQIYYMLCDNNLYLAAKCIMSCTYDNIKTVNLIKLSEGAIDDKCNNNSSVAMNALIELERHDIIFKRLVLKNSEYKMNNYIKGINLVLNSATVEILLKILLTCSDYLCKINTNSTPKYAKIRNNNLAHSTRIKKRHIKQLVDEIIARLKYLCKSNYPSQCQKLVNNILLNTNNPTSLILIVDALSITYVNIPSSAIKHMENHMQGLKKNNSTNKKLNEINLSEFTKKHLCP